MADYPDLAGAVNWSTCNGGNPPAAEDTLYLNDTCVLTLDTSPNDTYTCVAIKASTNAAKETYNQDGHIALGNATSTINANLRAGDTNPMITLSNAANKTLTIGAGTTVTGGSASNVYGISVTGSTDDGHTLTVNNVTGGSGNSAHGLYIDGGKVSLTINGTCHGGLGAGRGYYASGGTINYTKAIPAATASSKAHGIYNGANSTFTVTAAEGAGGSNFHGIYVAAGTVTVTTATGGNVAGSYGAYCGGGEVIVTTAVGGTHVGGIGAVAAGGTVTVNGVDLTQTGYPCSSSGGILKIDEGVPVQFSDTDGDLAVFPWCPDKAKVLVDTEIYSGYVGELKGIIDDAGDVHAKPGILGSNGTYYAKPGVLDVDGARTPIGVLDSDGEMHAEAVLQHDDDVYVAYALTSPQSVPYKTGAAAQLATDKDAVAAELANMTTAVQNLLDAGNDGTLSLDDVLTGAGGNWHAADAAEVISTATFGVGGATPGTYDVADVAAENILDGKSIGGVAGTEIGAAAQKVTDSEFLEDHKDEIITSDTDILGEFGVTGTAAGGALSRVRLGM